MVGLIKTVLSFEFLIGAILGIIAGYILKPLIDAGLTKLFSKNG